MSKSGRQVLSFDRLEYVPFEWSQTKGVTLAFYSPVSLGLCIVVNLVFKTSAWILALKVEIFRLSAFNLCSFPWT